MHIAVNGWFIGQQTTGSGQYLHHLLDHLPRQRSGIEVSVLVPSRTYNPIWHDRWPNTRLIPVDVPAMSRSLQKLWWEQVAFPRAARQSDPDVTWVPYWAAPLWQPQPLVVTVHDVIPLILPAYRGGIFQRAYTRLVSHTARRAASVLTVSHASARDIVRHLHIPRERVHVVYHGPNAGGAAIADAMETARVRYDLPSQYFLYLGGFDLRKNVAGVIHAYRRYLEMGGSPDVALVIAGSLPGNPSGVVSDPRAVVSELRLQEHVHFCGWVDEADKPALYALATAFVFPSLCEGFGMMALEAMAAGTPVITSAR